MQKINSIILAAGKSTRMKSATPKVLHPVCGKPLVYFPVHSSINAGADKVVLVIAKEFKEKFEPIFASNEVSFAIQHDQKGTADAVRSAQNAVDKGREYTLIIPGDVPLIKSETLKKLIDDTISKKAVCGVLTMEMDDPASYGRVVRTNTGDVKAIVEKKDAGMDELLIREVNSGIYCAKTDWLFNVLSKITPQNAQKEYYLTDIVKFAAEEGKKVIAICVSDQNEPMGVNTRQELSLANRLMRGRILNTLMTNGVGIEDENNTYIDYGVEIGEDTTIGPNCHITGKTKIGKACKIETGCIIKDMVIADNVQLKPYSVIEESEVQKDAVVGPFSRLRPGAVIETKAKVGNFVEIKKATIRSGAKANHLTYIGDAIIGERTNIGCGMITCNYDGVKKHKTIIGNDVFVGSDVQFVAPVTVGDNVTIAAGSTITEDVPDNSLAIARSRQVVKENWKKK